MKTKHTPEPWIIDDRMAKDLEANAFWFSIKDSNKNTIAEVKGHHYGIENKTAKANAKIIAAAPRTTELGILTRNLLYDHFDSLPNQLKPLLNKWRKAIQEAIQYET